MGETGAGRSGVVAKLQIACMPTESGQPRADGHDGGW